MATSTEGMDSGVHSCCKKTDEHKTWRSYAIAVFLACLCCSLPLIPLMLGLSAASSWLSLTKYHLLFDILGVIILYGTLIYIWREHKSTNKSVLKSKQFWTCLLVTFGMYAAMSFLVKQVMPPKLPVQAGQGNIHDHR